MLPSFTLCLSLFQWLRWNEQHICLKCFLPDVVCQSWCASLLIQQCCDDRAQRFFYVAGHGGTLPKSTWQSQFPQGTMVSGKGHGRQTLLIWSEWKHGPLQENDNSCLLLPPFSSLSLWHINNNQIPWGQVQPLLLGFQNFSHCEFYANLLCVLIASWA
jgi:hypothetical protein